MTFLWTKPLWRYVFAVTLFTACGPAIAGQFFVDDFEDYEVGDQTAVSWSESEIHPPWDVEGLNGDMFLTANRGLGSMVIDSDELFGDVILRTQVSFEAWQNDDFIGIFARATDDDCERSCGEYWGGIRADGIIAAGTYDFIRDTETVIEWNRSSLDPVHSDVMLELALQGRQIGLTAWQEGRRKPRQPQITFSDSQFSTGDIACPYGL